MTGLLVQVVIALAEGQKHIPYRQSKLTHVLRDSLHGEAICVLIAAIWPDAEHAEETSATLR